MGLGRAYETVRGFLGYNIWTFIHDDSRPHQPGTVFPICSTKTATDIPGYFTEIIIFYVPVIQQQCEPLTKTSVSLEEFVAK